MLSFLLFLLLPAVGYAQTLAGNGDEEENGLAEECRPQDKILDLLFILDGSGSVSGGVWENQIRMVKNIIAQVDVGPDASRIAIIQYSGWTRIEFDFNAHKNRVDIEEALNNLRFLTGTTRTGKALRKAIDVFSGDKNGARTNRSDVAKVIVLVSDGYSQDDPFPPAQQLNKMGVTVLALAIGEFVNMDELVEITGDPAKTFRNNSQTSVEQFTDAFKKIAVGEICFYATGAPRGAEIICSDMSIVVNVKTKKPIKGHLFVQGHYAEPGCSAQGIGEKTDLSLSIPLMHCGLRKQFMFEPRGMLFETAVTLKFHAELTTPLDKTFTVRCFYPDQKHVAERPLNITLNETLIGENLDGPTISKDLITTPTADSVALKMALPCSYTLRPQQMSSCLAQNAGIGDKISHRWECDRKLISEEYDMLVHSCYLTDGGRREILVVDEKGCPVDRNIFRVPVYESQPLLVTAESTVVKFADALTLQYRCSLKFCNHAKGECDSIVPPQCDTARHKRQAALARIRQMFDLLHEDSGSPTLNPYPDLSSLPWTPVKLWAATHSETRPTEAAKENAEPTRQVSEATTTAPSVDQSESAAPITKGPASTFKQSLSLPAQQVTSELNNKPDTKVQLIDDKKYDRDFRPIGLSDVLIPELDFDNVQVVSNKVLVGDIADKDFPETDPAMQVCPTISTPLPFSK